MLKRTKGYFLLTMLVLTGLAGRLHTDVLSGKERRFLINDLKATKSDFLKSTKGLSQRQLNFRPVKGAHSIKEYVYSLAVTEKALWNLSKNSLKKHTKPDIEATLKDDDLITILEKNSIAPEQPINIKNSGIKSTNLAIDLFKNERDDELHYVRTATDNLRHHTIKTTAGNLDIYQTIMMLCYYTRYYTKRIEQLKLNPNFPK